jgi:polyisoprenoid-binding protein YceI
MSTLTTDSSSRDRAARGRALNTDEFPEATFELTSPIELGSVPAPEVTVEVAATGDLTIKGVTQSVEFPLEAQLVEGLIVVVGQIQVDLIDFDIEAPTAPIVASVEDNATVELSLILGRS